MFSGGGRLSEVGWFKFLCKYGIFKREMIMTMIGTESAGTERWIKGKKVEIRN